jgi:hypothetical protein
MLLKGDNLWLKVVGLCAEIKGEELDVEEARTEVKRSKVVIAPAYLHTRCCASLDSSLSSSSKDN